MRTTEVAELLGVTPVTVRYRLAQRQIEPLRVHDRLFLIHSRDVHRLLDKWRR